jgi:perosamine synthetase
MVRVVPKSYPVCEPVLDGREVEYVTDAVSSGWISSAGPYLDRFETDFARYAGTKHAVAVCNGTAALQVAVRALDLPRGSEVVLPSFTIVSCALAVVDSGLVPVFVDVDPETWTLTAEGVRDALSEKSSAIMAVHMYGHPAEMDPILELGRGRGLRVIEDAAEAHGGTYRGRPCGSLGEVATFSFYANKLVSTGEGGMVTTDDARLAERVRSLRNLAFRSAQRFVHDELGWNFRMSNVLAALGVAQLETAERHLAARRQIAGWYRTRLGRLPGLQLQTERPWATNTFWMIGMVLGPERGVDAAALARRLAAAGIQTRPFFQPLHSQKPFARWSARWSERSFAETERLARWGLYLPSSVSLTENDVDSICAVVRDALPEYAT